MQYAAETYRLDNGYPNVVNGFTDSLWFVVATYIIAIASLALLLYIARKILLRKEKDHR